jgi:glycosyltransferase involved in cell wall biosynthesis
MAAAVVVLSERSRDVYESAGVATDKLVCVPNFVASDLTPRVSESDGGIGWLFVGRLSSEKGIDRLVKRWPADEPLTIVGEGPLMAEVRAVASGKRIELVGVRTRPEILDLMRSSLGLVFPSRWYEGFPMVYAEALASGLPVLAFEPSVVSDFVRIDKSGWATSWASDLGSTLRYAKIRFPAMRGQCRAAFDVSYTERVFLDRMVSLYRSVMARASV